MNNESHTHTQHFYHLYLFQTLLPSFEQNDGHEKIQTLQRMFNGENFKFGNPLQMFHKSLRGMLSYRGFPRNFVRAPNGALAQILGRHFLKNGRPCL